MRYILYRKGVEEMDRAEDKSTAYLLRDANESYENMIPRSYSVDDMAIITYGITEDELAPYMRPDAEVKHWSDVLDEILDARERNGTEYDITMELD